MKEFLSKVSQSFRTYLHSGVNTVPIFIILFCALILLSVLLFFLYRYYLRCRWKKELFDDLCKVNEISPVEKSLLSKISRSYNLPLSSLIFLRKGLLDSYREEGGETKELMEIRKKLFD